MNEAETRTEYIDPKSRGTIKKWLTNHYVLLLLIILLALSLRLINLGTEPYWGDEVLSLDIVKHYSEDIPGMLTYLEMVEVHPPLYYLLLNQWSKVFGYNEFGVRLLSLIFGLGVVVLTYLLSKKLFSSKRVALMAAFLTAVLPIQIEFSQEARPYIIFVFFGLLAALFFWYARDNHKKIFLLGYIISTLAGLYLHYSYGLFAVSLTLFWLIEIILYKDKTKRSKAIITWLSVHAIIFVGYYDQLITFLYKLSLGQFTIFGLPRMIASMRKISFFEALLNQILWLDKNLSVYKIEIFVIILFKIAFVAAIIYLLIKHSEKIKAPVATQYKQLLFVLWLILMPIILFFFSLQGVRYSPIYSRHTIIISSFIVIFIAYVSIQLKPKLRLFIVILFIASIMNFIILTVGNDATWDPYHRLKIMADQINAVHQPGDLVIIFHSSARSDFNYFLDEDISNFGFYPLELLDHEQDFLATRSTLGFIEMEFQLRFGLGSTKASSKTKEKIKIKMDYLVNKYQAKRIWLVWFAEDSQVSDWLEKNNWQKAISSLGQLHPVQLYRQNKE